MLQYIGTITANTTQDSGIHTMSSKRDSALNDGLYPYNYPDCATRRCNSDLTPILPCHASAHSSRSVDRLANRLQQAPMLKDNRDFVDNQDQISVFSHHVSNPGSYGKLFQEDRHPTHSHCSQNCCKPADPGGGISIQATNADCRAGSQCLQSQCCAVQTSHCSHSKVLHDLTRSNTEGR